MTDIRRMLDEEERAEYDQLHYLATHEKNGKRRKSADVGPEMLRLLKDAVQARKAWATWLMDDALIDGLRDRANKWARTKEIIETILGGRVVTKAAAYAIRKRDPESGKSEHQPTFWQDMSADDVRQLIQSRASQVLSERATIALARRVLELIERTESPSLGVALIRANLTWDEFLADQTVAS